jgi:methionyl-tRNA formyltransferase
MIMNCHNTLTPLRRGDAMVQRKIIPAYGGYNIAVATEQMDDGIWTAVATVTQSTDTAQRNIDLPVSKERTKHASCRLPALTYIRRCWRSLSISPSLSS